ncbi:MAG: hypothetical protein PHV28_11500, partial [Kiritimatiellae bacterium]|nr:hypothetical protein [Kiritimatiellia bacterium]
YDSSITNEQLEALGAGALRLAAIEGDEQKGCFMAGQIAGSRGKSQKIPREFLFLRNRCGRPAGGQT